MRDVKAWNIRVTAMRQNQDLPALRLGWREWVRLPSLGIERIKAKVDTGARTSALHAFKIERTQIQGVDSVRIWLHPLQYDKTEVVVCESPIIDQRSVRDSGGHSELRFVIETELLLGTESRKVELTVTSRETMRFRLLIGRTALQNAAVFPSQSYLLGKITA
ncbi:MAG: ATP-dependent zinc protease family protein [Pseudomonadales bacterium]